MKIKKVEKKNIEQYVFHIETGGQIVVVFDEDNQRFTLQTFNNNYSQSWGAIGAKTLKEFVCYCGNDYLMKNLMSFHSINKFDEEKTINEIKLEILKQRKSRDIDPQEAKLAWEELKQIVKSDDSRDFYNQFSKTELFQILYCGDPHGIPQCSKMSNEAIQLDIYLTIIKEYFKNEVK